MQRMQSLMDASKDDPESVTLSLDIANRCGTLLDCISALPNPRYLHLEDGSVFSFFQSIGSRPQGDTMPDTFSATVSVLQSSVLARIACLSTVYYDDTSAARQIAII